MNEQSHTTHPIRNAFQWILSLVGVLALCGVGIVVVTLIIAIWMIVRYGSMEAGYAAIEAGVMDRTLFSTAVTQFSCAIVLFLVWLRMYRRSILRARSEVQASADGQRIVKWVLILLVSGLVLQTFIGMMMELVFRAFPSLQEVYGTVTQTVENSARSVVATLPITIGAPIFEELLTRGVLFEYLLRAFARLTAPVQA